MRSLYVLIFLFVVGKASAQDVVYAITGEKMPAKIVSFTADKIKYKKPDNLTGPDYSKSTNNVLIAFNASGSYLVFADKNAVSDEEKAEFISETPAPKSADVLIDVKGGLTELSITSETGTTVSGVFKKKPIKIQKSLLVAVIRKNGTHQLFIAPDKAAAILVNVNAKTSASANPAPAPGRAIAAVPVTTTPTATGGDEMNVDVKMFAKKAEAKIGEFSNYVNTICQVNTDRELAKKSINLAVDLFISEKSKVEISSINSNEKVTREIRLYLERLQLRSKSYDNVKVQYANINYASKFTKGADGNYYATITFVQKFQGFVDGKVVYGDKTKRNIQVVLKQYEKSVSGETQKGWDVFFDDMGVLETKKV